MQLSCKKGIGFVCIPKCGSSTVEALMRPHSDFSLTNNPHLKHIRYSELEDFVFPLLNNMRVKKPFIFAIMREPISWMRSWYQFRARDELSNPDLPQHRNYSGHVSFAEFVENCMLERPPSYARVHSQSSYILSKNGTVGVDATIPLEKISTELPPLLANYGIQISGSFASKNVSKKMETEPLPEKLVERLRSHLRNDFRIYESCMSHA